MQPLITLKEFVRSSEKYVCLEKLILESLNPRSSVHLIIHRGLCPTTHHCLALFCFIELKTTQGYKLSLALVHFVHPFTEEQTNLLQTNLLQSFEFIIFSTACIYITTDVTLGIVSRYLVIGLMPSIPIQNCCPIVLLLLFIRLEN